MIYVNINEEKTGIHEASAGSSKRISKDGNIVAAEYSSIANNNGFRPGMMPLRSIKMHWTLNEFVSMDSQFEYKIKRQESSFCKQEKQYIR